MAMTKEKIRMEINAEVKTAIQKLKDLEKQKNKNKKAISGINASLKRMAGFAIGAFGVREIGLFAKESVQANARVKTMERAFLNLGKSVGVNDKSLGKLRGALNGTVKDTDLLRQANNAMLLGIVDSDDQMAELFDNAQRLAQALGKDALYGIESLTTGIGRQSRLMLDNLGIIVKAEDAYKFYAEQLGKSTSELTDNERKQAFIKATMESVREKVAQLGVEVLDLNQLFEANSVSTENLKQVIGEQLEPVFKKMVSSSIKIKDAVAEFVKNISDKQIKTFKEFAKTLSLVVGLSIAGSVAMNAWKNATIILGQAGLLTKKAFKWLLVFEAVDLLRSNVDQLQIEIMDWILWLDDKFSFWRDDSEKQKTIDQFNKKFAEIQRNAEQTGKDLTQWDAGLAGDAWDHLIGKSVNYKEEIKKAGDAIKDGVDGLEDQGEQLDENEEHALSMAEAIQKTNRDLGASVREGGKLGDAIKRIITNLILEMTYLRIKLAIEKKITSEKRKQTALSWATGFFGFATGGSYVSGLPKANSRASVGGSNSGFMGITNKKTILPTNPPALVGDNASGRELVQVTPLPSPNAPSSRPITININSPMVDQFVVDQIIPAIRKAEELNL